MADSPKKSMRERDIEAMSQFMAALYGSKYNKRTGKGRLAKVRKRMESTSSGRISMDHLSQTFWCRSSSPPYICI